MTLAPPGTKDSLPPPPATAILEAGSVSGGAFEHHESNYDIAAMQMLVIISHNIS